MIRNSKSRLVGILYSSDPMTTRDRPQQSRGISSQREHNPRDCQATPTNSNFNSLIYGKESGSTAKIEKTAKRLGLFLSDFNLVRRYLGITLQPFLPECDFPLVFSPPNPVDSDREKKNTRHRWKTVLVSPYKCKAIDSLVLHRLKNVDFDGRHLPRFP